MAVTQSTIFGYPAKLVVTVRGEEVVLTDWLDDGLDATPVHPPRFRWRTVYPAISAVISRQQRERDHCACCCARAEARRQWEAPHR